MSKSDEFEKWTSGSKNVLQIVLFFVVMVLLFSTRAQKFLGQELAFLTASGVESVKIGELEFKLKQAQDATRALANAPQSAPSPSTPIAKPQDKNPLPSITAALETINEPGGFWTYLGQFENGHFLHTPNYKISSVPSPGMILTATTDVYKRSSAPIQVGTEWKLGEIVGVLKEGQQAQIRQVQTIESGNIWLQTITADH